MIERHILKQLQAGRTVALATIMDKSGSAPRLPGSKMFLDQDGALHDTIGGGKMEYESLAACREILDGGAPRMLHFDMTVLGPDRDADMICGGILNVLIERITPELAAQYELALECARKGSRGVWVVDITEEQNPQRSFVDMTENKQPMPGLDLKSVMRGRSTKLLHDEHRTFLVDPLPKSGTLVLFGGGHVSRAVAELASGVGFDVKVVDDREEFSNAERFPMARAALVIPDFENAGEAMELDDESFAVIMTRGHAHDRDVLAQVLRSPARYIGMIGSIPKRNATYKQLLERGFTEEELARVHCPIGLKIGAETPEEIAVSILAELIAARAGKI
ncbi:XdhC family aldehyde oxidoreductase maturation factor [Salidesulfovibrio onnuriiensis]|uniref:XdhC family aldehyde oxidoreductase maturation factor n=1 Tax=Salidesulfovibrio onnuriiensis TaxID=2583823 RepID=UPI0011C9ADB4|nr:XdhC/CoxI family protein [Salidesulfovibrio onnuriiensis]